MTLYKNVDIKDLDSILKNGNIINTKNKNGKIVNGYNLDDYTVEICFECGLEQVVKAKGTGKCVHCNGVIYPCSVCEDCSYENCPYGRIGHIIDYKEKPTNKHLTAEELGLLDALKKNDKEVDK